MVSLLLYGILQFAKSKIPSYITFNFDICTLL